MPGPSSDSVPRTILVVEDEAMILSLMNRILTRAGYRVLNAANPAQALEIMDSEAAPIDLLVTDLSLPGMTGATLATLLIERQADLRILVTSGHALESVSGDLPAGAGFLSKPFTPGVLLEAVRNTAGVSLAA